MWIKPMPYFIYKCGKNKQNGISNRLCGKKYTVYIKVEMHIHVSVYKERVNPETLSV